MKVHTKLYGSCETSYTPCVIENPDLVRMEMLRVPAPKPVEATPLAVGPTNKQIEMRTADGRRRITPMYIPPPETDCDIETSFSSSRPEKSTIQVEKVCEFLL